MDDTNIPREAHLDFLDTIRTYELDMVRCYLPPVRRGDARRRLLELGAGTGAQARRLFQMGYEVTAIEVANSSYRAIRCFDILDYDGKYIPKPDQSQDIIFSSHVLEHVIEVEKVLEETYRTLKNGGVCIHLIPTPFCRIWTLFSHYLWLIRRIFKKIMLLGCKGANSGDVPRTPSGVKGWVWTIIPPVHGERGNTLTEVYYYSQHFWCSKFEKCGFEVVAIHSNRIFYTMANSFGSKISLRIRRILSKILGSSCYIYILRKKV